RSGRAELLPTAYQCSIRCELSERPALNVRVRHASTVRPAAALPQRPAAWCRGSPNLQKPTARVQGASTERRRWSEVAAGSSATERSRSDTSGIRATPAILLARSVQLVLETPRSPERL